MAKLRLRNPAAPSHLAGPADRLVIDVAASVPVPHLEGVYSYRNHGQEVEVGSVVSIPFGGSETFGVVVNLRLEGEEDARLKRILKVLQKEPLFKEASLNRYRRIAELYGASLFTVISSAVSVWGSNSLTKGSVAPLTEKSSFASEPDGRYLATIFGQAWRDEPETHLLLPIGVPWERVAVSLFLDRPERTLVLVPTERMLNLLANALSSREVDSFVAVTSHLRKSERSRINHKLVSDPPQLLIGTRGAALAPFEPERIIIIDSGDMNYAELRSPFFRGDDTQLWEGLNQVVTLSHARDLSTLARGKRYIRGRSGGKYTFQSTSLEASIEDLSKVIRKRGRALSILISVNDKSYSSGLVCSSCRNSSRCECGFPLRVSKRGSTPDCSKCLRKYESYLCVFCGGTRLMATKGGSESLALSMAKSIKNSRIFVSNSTVPKSHLSKSDQHDIVIATHGLEPQLIDGDGQYLGYDVIIMLGGRAAFSGASLHRTDRFRIGWSRLLGLANPKECFFLLDLDFDHPEFFELRRMDGERGLEVLLTERRELFLPPFSLLVELSADDGVLHKLRSALLSDEIFTRKGNEIFPVHDSAMIVRVNSNDRHELLQLLQSMTRLRSSNRLPRVAYRVDPQDRG